ncbi:MAG TPA: DUF503 domain-containing protein [Clostridiales bacterium]|nr:DUF503 domain-containing protein [Clostridiales bacterium]
MEVLYATFRLRAPWCRSLKDKRSVVKSLIAELKKHNASVCESGAHDASQFIELTVAALVKNHAQGDSTAQLLESCVLGATDAELYEVTFEYR